MPGTPVSRNVAVTARATATAIAAAAVAAATLVPVASAASAAEGGSDLTLSGNISVTGTQQSTYDDDSFTYGPGAVTYTGVSTVSSSTDPDGTRRAILTADSVSINYESVFTSSNCDGGARNDYEFSYSGSPSGLIGAGEPRLLAEVAVTPAGDVLFHPYSMIFNADGMFTGCGLSYPVSTGATVGSYLQGSQPAPRRSTADSDPSPHRIYASASYGLDSLPFDPSEAPPNMTAYSYSFDLDLRVGGVAAVDDPKPGSMYQQKTGLGNVLTIPVTANDVGDGIRVVAAQLAGAPGTISYNDSSVMWTLPSGTRPALGTYKLVYAIADRHGQQDSAEIHIRLYDCFSINQGLLASVDRAGPDDGYSLSMSTRLCFDGERVFDVSDGGDVDRTVPVDVLPLNGLTAQWTLPSVEIGDSGDKIRYAVSSDASECLAALDFAWGLPKTFGKLRQLFVKAYGQATATYVATNYKDELDEAYQSLADNSSYCFASYLSASLNVYYDAHGQALVTINSDVHRRGVRSVVATVEQQAPDSGAGVAATDYGLLPHKGSGEVSFLCDAYTGCSRQ